jgi:drug/metabolite transporter (DMT)-like permease
MASRLDERQHASGAYTTEPSELQRARATRGSAPWLLVGAFAVVYLVWGSTYLAIRFAVETIPPLLMAGTRFLAAGGALYLWCVLRGRTRADADAGGHGATRAYMGTRAQWQAATITGLFLIAASYGLVSWAELTVPSGVVALITAMTPLWMVLFSSLAAARRPTALVIAGVAIGLAAQALLFGVGSTDQTRLDPWGLGAVLLAGISWALGSLRSRKADLPADAFLGSAMQMLTGGTVLVALGLLAGEGAHFTLGDISRRSALAWVYLVVAGSMIAYSAYLYLLKSTTAARASTYAYVNPIVAVFLGWLLAGEPFGPRTIAAMALTLVAVLAINYGGADEKQSA